jgi:pyruvate formate lyase activating enzyme
VTEPPREAERAASGLVWDIRRYTLHDGPGIRTAVFFKGCPLGCLWCANPEAQARGAELLWIKERCLACDLCRGTCPHWAISLDDNGEPHFDRELCDLCGLCTMRCPGGAMNLVGREMTVDEVLQEVMRDEGFYMRSGGGLTLSGGEPLAQPGFAAAILERYKVEERGRHTTVETCGHAAWEALAPLVPFTDLFLFDVKHMDGAEHRRLTGAGNELILDNAARLAASSSALVIRLPLVPGCNDSDDNVRRTAEFARSLQGVTRIDILPYHRLGEPKYARLGRTCPLAGTAVPTGDTLARASAIIEEAGLTVRIGG